MYLGQLTSGQRRTSGQITGAAAVGGGETKRFIAQKGRKAACPPGWAALTAGRLGTGQQYVECYAAPRAAVAPRTTVTYEAPRTTISPSLQTQISPQVSPVLTQMQASPGAAVTAAPTQVAPAPMTRQTGITAADLQRILKAQSEARIAEEEARERKSTAETEELRRQMAERTRAMETIAASQRAGEMRRIEEERFAREQAERAARETAQALPPPPSFAAPMPIPAPIQAAAPMIEPMLTPAETEIEITGEVVEAGAPPWLMIALLAAGVGAVVLVGGKKRKRRTKR